MEIADVDLNREFFLGSPTGFQSKAGRYFEDLWADSLELWGSFDSRLLGTYPRSYTSEPDSGRRILKEAIEELNDQ